MEAAIHARPLHNSEMNNVKDHLVLDDRYCLASSDCSLVSSDGVEFLFMKQRLMCISSVFQDMLKTLSPNDSTISQLISGNDTTGGNNKKETISKWTAPIFPNHLRLTDEQFETCYQIRKILDFVHGHWDPLQDDGLQSLPQLLAFAKKWDCHLMFSNFIQAVAFHGASRNKFTAPLAFALCASYHRPDICGSLLKTNHDLLAKYKSINAAGIPRGRAVEHCVLDPYYFALDLWDLIPKRILYALSRAFRYWRPDMSAQVYDDFKRAYEEWDSMDQ